jgi:hypothetical protein
MDRRTYAVTLPHARDPLARWFEDHRAEVSLVYGNGKWSANLTWREEPKDSDTCAVSPWPDVTCKNEDPYEAIRLVWEAAQAEVVARGKR